MLPAEQTRGDSLLTLARSRFDPVLRPIEERVLRHSCAYDDPTSPNPTTGQLPELRPSLIRWLLTDPAATSLLETRGLRIWHARLTQPLDLIGCAIPVRLELRYCQIEAPLLLASASLPTLSLRNSTLQQGLDAPFLKLHGPLHCNDITAAGKLNFNGATIAGEVRLGNTTLTAATTALSLAGASIANDLLLAPKFQSSGSLYLHGVRVGGYLDLPGASLTATGEALDLDFANVKGGIFLQESFTCAGTIHMRGTEVGGQFNCSSANLTATGEALSLDGAKIYQNALLIEGFQCSGEVRMLGVEIGGQLSFRGAKLTAIGDTLSLQQARIREHVFLDEGFEAAGAVSLYGAQIGGQLACGGAKLTATGDTLSLDRATVNGDAMLNDGFTSAGTLRLIGTTIGGQLNCTGASIETFLGENLEVKGELLWVRMRNTPQTSLDLNGAKMKILRDDPASWPAKGNLQVNGLLAQDFSPLQVRHLHTTGRIAWLNLQPEAELAEPQPWMHLAGHFEAKGHKRAAKRVLFELRKHQSRANWKNSRFHRFGHRWDIAFASLERQPFYILIPILLLASLSGFIFSLNKAHFAETSDSAYRATHTPNPQAAAPYPRFQPFVYALEDVLPVVKLGQDAAWAPDANPARTAPALYRSLVVLRWTLILLGWVMGGILAAAVSARFRS